MFSTQISSIFVQAKNLCYSKYTCDYDKNSGGESHDENTISGR